MDTNDAGGIGKNRAFKPFARMHQSFGQRSDRHRIDANDFTVRIEEERNEVFPIRALYILLDEIIHIAKN